MIQFRNKIALDKTALVIFLTKKQLRQKQFETIPNDSLRIAVRQLAALRKWSTHPGETFPLLWQDKVVLVVSVDEAQKNYLTALRTYVRSACLSEHLKSIAEVEILLPDQNDATVVAVLEGILIGTYSWSKYKAAPTSGISWQGKKYYLPVGKKKIFEDVITTCAGVNLARDLINDNADVVNSACFEKAVKELVGKNKSVKLEILNQEELKKYGLNLHLAVNQASRNSPKLIIAQYTGDKKLKSYTAFVGKGITFDSGGLNLKPSGHIETMRCDMSGAAAILGVLSNVLAFQPKKNLLFAFAIAENAIGSAAYKPGDVIRSYSGKTVEIANTDAEGRLVLADAISYVIKNYPIDSVIDIATLTGACVIALGHDYTGLVASDEILAAKLLQSAAETDDRLWRLPNYPELKDAVESTVADIRNTGFSKGAAGTITAAEFLRQFTEDKPWAHLDIAGTAFLQDKGRLYYSSGATGAGVRLLTAFIKHL